jgi:hypothetical protein
MERDNLMHGARTALNTIPEAREWAEQYLKEKARSENGSMSDEDLRSLFAYLQSIPAVRNRVPKPVDAPEETGR